MTRIQVIVEGPTEESFIRNVVASSLWDRTILVQPHYGFGKDCLCGTAEQNGVRAGICLPLAG